MFGLVDDGSVVAEPVELVGLRCESEFGDDEFDFEGLRFGGEDSGQRLCVCVRQTASGDVGAVVGGSAQIGVADTGLAQGLEFVVLSDGGEADPVVDLSDLVQRR